jgi:protein-tyrosine phosphatase
LCTAAPALLVAGHDADEVVADYALSGAQIAPSRRPQLAHLEPLDADSLVLHLESPAEAMRAALAIVDEFGGPHAYLLKHGVTPEQLSALAEKAAR